MFLSVDADLLARIDPVADPLIGILSLGLQP